MDPRRYHASSRNEYGYIKGFALCFEEGDYLVDVPEASHILFRTQAEAMDFAAELEAEDEQAQRESEA